MKLLKDKIILEGLVVNSEILKVSSFLNHQLDVKLLDAIGDEFSKLFCKKNVTRILTIESSGIALACAVARKMNNVPVVFAKKNKSGNVPEDVYTTSIYSFTHNKSYDIIVSKNFLHKDDNVLIIDDFLAKGSALNGLIDIIKQSGANFVGAGIAIEKGFQDGGKKLREQGFQIESLVIIEKMDCCGNIFFKN